jgi:hypothetical protein
MAQWSKFIGASSRNEFWEPQEVRQKERLPGEGKKEIAVAVKTATVFVCAQSGFG